MHRPLALAAILALLPAAAGIPFSANAEGEVAAKIGPEIGSKAVYGPLADLSGAPADMAALAGQRGTAVVFVRSAEWCPFCKKQLVDLEAAKAPLAAQGWSLVSVSYDAPEKLAAFAADSDVSYPLLSDAGSETIIAFNLLNTGIEKGTRAYGVPHPAVIFIGAGGKVDAILREESYRDRPANEVVIETATRLAAKG